MTSSNHSPRIHALIVAAGKGARFGAKKAKQYQEIDLTDFGIDIKQTVLQFSVAALARHPMFERCTLVVAADDELAKTLDFDLACEFVIGGQTRFESVKAGLKHIAGYAKPSDYVLIHDAARPCVSLRDIKAVIDQALHHRTAAGAILAHPVADTLKSTQTIQTSTSIPNTSIHAHSISQTISHSVSREHLWQALTPQVFHLERLLTAIDELQVADECITDEASVFELSKNQQAVLLTQGSRANLKLTYVDDLPMIQCILAHTILTQHDAKSVVESN